MSLKNWYYCFLTAVVIVALYHIFAVGRYTYPEFRIKAGQVAEFELLAPFDFPVLKSAEQLVNEQEKSLSRVKQPYSPNEEIVFGIYRNVDDIFLVLNRSENEAVAQAGLEKLGYQFALMSLSPMLSAYVREKAYNGIVSMLESLYHKGVYENVNSDSMLVYRDKVLMEVPTREFISVEEAQSRFKTAFRDNSFAAFVSELAAQLIKPNLEINDGKYKELREDRTSSLPLIEGVILQNEVIIRKNARVTENDIAKLQSLQEAYKNKNIRKTAGQQLLLTLGLLIFNLIIIYSVTYYFQIQGTVDIHRYSDIMPIHLGIVLIVLLAIINNLVLGYGNVLIPFAFGVLATMILVGFEFSVFYCIANMLIVSPFINWETYTPVFFILSTILTMIILKRNNAYHEYFSIWFYLCVSSVIVGITIAIYKTDPFMVMAKNIGLSLISATVSVVGIMLVVPFYERKWNRATKQTLLELLDFNHPLLKKLATDAVGTYHHSLIVGNLTERAAEAIGANPLLARVGSYYHDIGKVVNTNIFTENNESSTDIHNGLSAVKSAEMIKHHVFEGIELAHKYKIPQPVIDIIMQHHGTGTIRYFLDKAQKEGYEIDPELFRYPGPRPQSKEAVLVMLADMVESTTKSKNLSSREEIETIIDDTILRLLRDHQLEDSPITMQDLKKAKEAMLPILQSIYRKRLDYPEEKKHV